MEPTIPASERPQTHALDCAATGFGTLGSKHVIKQKYAVLAVNCIMCYFIQMLILTSQVQNNISH